ncbi:hypothetical protein H920_05657 [Fukomys damarensis]|uniref:Uncharacterized protein n=1 Tax=Fukomys damarensis TaxID=885580 RepID=A0A091ECJ3_FUKDA|nr:hypothetical protein H920_05657 [Fukomys damarensis]
MELLGDKENGYIPHYRETLSTPETSGCQHADSGASGRVGACDQHITDNSSSPGCSGETDNMEMEFSRPQVIHDQKIMLLNQIPPLLPGETGLHKFINLYLVSGPWALLGISRKAKLTDDQRCTNVMRHRESTDGHLQPMSTRLEKEKVAPRVSCGVSFSPRLQVAPPSPQGYLQGCENEAPTRMESEDCRTSENGAQGELPAETPVPLVLTLAFLLLYRSKASSSTKRRPAVDFLIFNGIKFQQ